MKTTNSLVRRLFRRRIIKTCHGSKFHSLCFTLTGLIHNREKQEIKTVRIVKRESERRQRDRGDRTGNIGIPLTNGLQAPGGAKRFCDDDLGGSQKFEVSH